MLINEIVKFEKSKDIFNVLDMVKTACSSFMHDVNNAQRLLWRGGSHLVPPFYSDISPENRIPLGQSGNEQKILDIIFKMSGFSALRSNSICCSSNVSSAEQFGVTYMIFPKNGYSFTWGSHVEDIGGHGKLRRLLHDWAIPKNEWSKGKTGDIPTKEEADEFIKIFGFSNNNMSEALLSQNEIAIHGEYIAISRYYYEDVCNYFNIIEGS